MEEEINEFVYYFGGSKTTILEIQFSWILFLDTTSVYFFRISINVLFGLHVLEVKSVRLYNLKSLFLSKKFMDYTI